MVTQIAPAIAVDFQHQMHAFLCWFGKSFIQWADSEKLVDVGTNTQQWDWSQPMYYIYIVVSNEEMR